VPAAAGVLEVGVNEAFEDGALGELHDGERGPRAASSIGRTCLGEPDQLADIDLLAGRDGPVGAAGEEGRGRVLLPDQFEHDLPG
jgi:hypothetical protein